MAIPVKVVSWSTFNYLSSIAHPNNFVEVKSSKPSSFYRGVMRMGSVAIPKYSEAHIKKYGKPKDMY